MAITSISQLKKWFANGQHPTADRFAAIFDSFFHKSEAYSKEELNAMLSAIPKFDYQVVETLPTTNISSTTVYIVPGTTDPTVFTEHIYKNGSWYNIGAQKISLAEYAKKADVPSVIDNLTTDDSANALSAKQGKALFEMATEYDVSAHNDGKAYTLVGTAQAARLFVKYPPSVDGDIIVSLGGNVATVSLSATGHSTPALVAAAIAAETYVGYSVSYIPGHDYVDLVADSVGAKVAPGIDLGTTGTVITIEETTAGADSAVAAVPAWFQKGSLVLKFLSAVSGNYERYYNSSTGWSANINLWTPIFDGKFIPILFRKGGFAYADAQWYTKFNYVDNRLCSQGFAACDIIVNIPDGYMMACITGTIGRPATNANWERGRLVIRKDMGHVRLLLKRTDETSVPDMLDIDSMPLSFYDELNHEGLSQSLEDLSKVVLSHALVLHQGSVNYETGALSKTVANRLYSDIIIGGYSLEVNDGYLIVAVYELNETGIGNVYTISQQNSSTVMYSGKGKTRVVIKKPDESDLAPSENIVKIYSGTSIQDRIGMLAKATDNLNDVVSEQDSMLNGSGIVSVRQGQIYNTTWTWKNINDTTLHYIFPVSGSDVITVAGADDHTTPVLFLADNVSPVLDAPASNVGVFTIVAAGSTSSLSVPTGARFVFVQKSINGNDRSPKSIMINGIDVFTLKSLAASMLYSKITEESTRARLAENEIRSNVGRQVVSPNLYTSDFSSMQDVLAAGWSVASGGKSITNGTNYGIENRLVIDREYGIDPKFWIFDFDMKTPGTAYFGSYPSAFRMQARGRSTAFLDLSRGKFGTLAQIASNDMGPDVMTEIQTEVDVDNHAGLVGEKLRVVVCRGRLDSAVGHYAFLFELTRHTLLAKVPLGGYSFDRPCCFASTPINLYKIAVNTRLADSSNVSMMIFGDSITEGAGASVPSKSYPYLIASHFGKSMCLVSGRSSGQINGVIARLKSEASKLRPGIIMVTIGTNGNNTEEKLKEMTDLILSIGARPILNHIPMMTSVSGTKTVNDMIDKVVASYGHGTVGCCRFDVATAVGNDPAQGQDTSLFISDLIHPNDAGHLCLMNQAKIDCPEIFQNILI